MYEDGQILQEIPAAEKSISRFVKKKPTKLRLNEMKMIMDYLPTFLECLVWVTSITDLVVPCQAAYSMHDPMQLLEGFLPTNQSIRRVTFRGRLPHSFGRFVGKFIGSSNDRIKYLVFQDCDMPRECVSFLMNWIREKPLETLEIVNSIPPIVAQEFVAGLENNPGASELVKLVLDQTATIDVDKLIPLVSSLKYLSVERCDCDIVDVIKTMGQNLEHCNLETIRISANKCLDSQLIPDDFELPPSLTHIVANDMYWYPRSLRNFFTRVAQRPELPLRLELANTKLPPNSWPRFFDRLSKLRGSLTSLVWDGNPVSERFFAFLAKCPVLTSISLNGCFTPEDPLVEDCARYLQHSQMITHFSCVGTLRQSLNLPSVRMLIISLMRNKSVKSFNISGNHTGSEILRYLGPVLLNNRRIEEVMIEDNDIQDIQSWRGFFSEMLTRGTPLSIVWPADEMRMMAQFGTASDREISDVQKLYQRVVAGDARIVVPVDNEGDSDESDDSLAPAHGALVGEAAVAAPAQAGLLG
jgi:hypothetical protein